MDRERKEARHHHRTGLIRNRFTERIRQPVKVQADTGCAVATITTRARAVLRDETDEPRHSPQPDRNIESLARGMGDLRSSLVDNLPG